MGQFIAGWVLGSLLTAGLGLAGTLYDPQGRPAAPRGSIQQYDYFRQRQQQLDVGALRRQAEQQPRGTVPCQR